MSRTVRHADECASCRTAVEDKPAVEMDSVQMFSIWFAHDVPTIFYRKQQQQQKKY